MKVLWMFNTLSYSLTTSITEAMMDCTSLDKSDSITHTLDSM